MNYTKQVYSLSQTIFDSCAIHMNALIYSTLIYNSVWWICMAIAQAVNYFYIYFYIHIPKRRAYSVFQVFLSTIDKIYSMAVQEFSKG